MKRRDPGEVLLAQDQDLRKLIAERRRYEGPFVSHETLAE